MARKKISEEEIAAEAEAAAKEALEKERPRRALKPKREEEAAQVEENYLVPIEEYLKAGIHIGSQYKTGDMRRYIYKTRPDGLHVLDIKTIDNRVRQAAEFISGYEPARVLVVAGRVYARRPARKFAEAVGAKVSTKRFIPGTMTNPNSPLFTEPEVVVVSDPGVDKQAVKEAITARAAVVGLCDTNNLLKNVDLVVPLNNKGKKSLALVYWLLAREVLLKRGMIKSPADFKATIEEYESTGK
jgi:small subunit ribosomal protein S2